MRFENHQSFSGRPAVVLSFGRSEEHTSELQSQSNLVCRLLLEKKTEERAHRPALAVQSNKTPDSAPTSRAPSACRTILSSHRLPHSSIRSASDLSGA